MIRHLYNQEWPVICVGPPPPRRGWQERPCRLWIRASRLLAFLTFPPASPSGQASRADARLRIASHLL